MKNIKTMIVMGCNKNNQLFPLVFAIMGKNIDDQEWFLTYIRNEVSQRSGLCVILDRH